MEIMLEVFVGLVAEIELKRDTSINLQNIFKSVQVFFRLKVND